MSNQASLLGHIERTARKVLSGSIESVGPYSVQEFVERTTRLAKKVLVEPANFADPSLAGSYLPLIQKLVQIRYARVEGGIFAFTSVAPGDGVSYVVETLAGEIARHTGEHVLLAQASSLSGLAPAYFRDAGSHPTGTRARVWRLMDTYSDSYLLPASLLEQSVEMLRQRFGYVLVDCPALKSSGAVFSLAKASDGVLLVVAAGQARRDQVEHAQRLIEDSNCNLLGLVLNKRTYPVPRFIYKHL